MRNVLLGCCFLFFVAHAAAAPHHCNGAADKQECRNKLKKKLNISDAELVDLHLTNPEKGLGLAEDHSHEDDSHSHESHEHDADDDGTFPIGSSKNKPLEKKGEAAPAPAKASTAATSVKAPTGFATLNPVPVAPIAPVQIREQFFRGPYVNGKGEAIPFLKRVIEFYYYPVDGALPVAGEIAVPVAPSASAVGSAADPDLRAFERIASSSSQRIQRQSELAALMSRRRAGVN